jgi:hypothetical protein
MEDKPIIEVMVHKSTGRLTHCFVLGDDGECVAALPITELRERFDPTGPGIVSIDLHSFRVKRTEYA